MEEVVDELEYVGRSVSLEECDNDLEYKAGGDEYYDKDFEFNEGHVKEIYLALQICKFKPIRAKSKNIIMKRQFYPHF